MNRQIAKIPNRPLQVAKFGGTSVGDAGSIHKVVEIVRDTAREADLVVVVSAMSGVTNQLIEAAGWAAAGKREAVERTFAEVRRRHAGVVEELVGSARDQITRRLEEVFQAGERLFEAILSSGELTPCRRDATSSLGERLSAPLIAAMLNQHGVASQAIDATELIHTNYCHGSADPDMDATGRLCQVRLGPLLADGVVPVVTGFIGATAAGVLTTLGRGGSDYSATILGAALHADEVTIWTDVDGMMTADPRLAQDAVTIPEISYREAAELAGHGAKVLHPKTLQPVTECGIPLWIRNTFAPERPGTRITSAGVGQDGGVTGLTVITEDVVQVFEVLHRDFVLAGASPRVESVAIGGGHAIVTLVGKDLRVSQTAERALAALRRANVGAITGRTRTSVYSISFVISIEDIQIAIQTMHREFGLGQRKRGACMADSLSADTAAWSFEPLPGAASAD